MARESGPSTFNTSREREINYELVRNRAYMCFLFHSSVRTPSYGYIYNRVSHIYIYATIPQRLLQLAWCVWCASNSIEMCPPSGCVIYCIVYCIHQINTRVQLGIWFGWLVTSASGAHSICQLLVIHYRCNRRDIPSRQMKHCIFCIHGAGWRWRPQQRQRYMIA